MRNAEKNMTTTPRANIAPMAIFFFKFIRSPTNKLIGSTATIISVAISRAVATQMALRAGFVLHRSRTLLARRADGSRRVASEWMRDKGEVFDGSKTYLQGRARSVCATASTP